MFSTDEVLSIFDKLDVNEFSLGEFSCSGVGIDTEHSRFEIDYDGKTSANMEIYHHFLTRVQETISDTTHILIVIDTNGEKLYRFFIRDSINARNQKYSGWLYPSRDSAKEAAIKYVLKNKLLEPQGS
jgi:hypothetical protein